MRLSTFKIENFKGISRTSVHLSDEVPGNVITLIGLNESGKTTILEGISHFVTEDKETASLVRTVHQRAGLQDLIPKDKKAAFTGNISIDPTIAFDKKDIDGLAEFFLSEHNLVLDKSRLPKHFSVERVYKFVDSSHDSTSTLWSISFQLKSKRATKFRGYGGSTEETKSIWLSGIRYLNKLLPQIVYFPTFLFNFPDRIYLEQSDREIDAYYKQIFQDVLDSQGDKLSVERHIVERIKVRREGFPTPASFIAHLLGLDEKSQIDAVTQKLSNEMSRVIFGAWSGILGKEVSDKRVQVDWFVDSEKSNSPYLQVSIIDGQSKYALSERSLGFRWFFSFLLFTQFRRSRKEDSGIVFLFDEPASNLHSRAQIKLLESFSKIAGGVMYVIYSTHSHYMVNPLWLEKAYIIDNKAINYDDDSEVDSFAVRKTDIHAVKYRHFVSANPTKTTYFQPVLDALEVSFSPLERSARALIVEGKFDFHPFLYFRGKGEPDIFPANGAGGIGCLINLFRGWGVEFRILLDDDKAGRDARAKYVREYLVPTSDVVTLGEISGEFKGKAFESVYREDVKKAVRSFFGIESIKKRQYSLFFQDRLARQSQQHFPDTEMAFRPIKVWIEHAFMKGGALGG
jgi:AAA ATPase domain